MSIDLFRIKEELVVFLRQQIQDTHDPARTSTETEFFSGDNVTTRFELTKDISRNGFHLLKNVNSVKVNGVEKTNYTDYEVDYQNNNPGTINFATAPDNSSNDNIEIGFSWGLLWIGTDLNRVEMSAKSCPKISVELLSAPSDEIALGATVLKSPLSISMTIICNKVSELDLLTKQIRDAILGNRTGFHNFNLITEPRVSPTITSGDPEAYMFQRTIDWTLPNNYEFFDSGVC